MKIKICGLKHADNIKAVAALQPDYMGFICYELSPRFISGLSAEVIGSLPADVYKTAVFVNETSENITQLIHQYGFNAIQLHGSESPDFCAGFLNIVTVIKAFGVDENFDFEVLKAFEGRVDYFLFDTKTANHGGSGKTFDWQVLDNYHLEVPFFISGGLSLENIESIKAIDNEQFYGVDLNSRFETEPGLKDIDRLQAAFKILKQPVEK